MNAIDAFGELLASDPAKGGAPRSHPPVYKSAVLTVLGLFIVASPVNFNLGPELPFEMPLPVKVGSNCDHSPTTTAATTAAAAAAAITITAAAAATTMTTTITTTTTAPLNQLPTSCPLASQNKVLTLTSINVIANTYIGLPLMTFFFGGWLQVPLPAGVSWRSFPNNHLQPPPSPTINTQHSTLNTPPGALLLFRQTRVGSTRCW